VCALELLKQQLQWPKSLPHRHTLRIRNASLLSWSSKFRLVQVVVLVLHCLNVLFSYYLNKLALIQQLATCTVHDFRPLKPVDWQPTDRCPRIETYSWNVEFEQFVPHKLIAVECGSFCSNHLSLRRNFQWLRTWNVGGNTRLGIPIHDRCTWDHILVNI